MRICDLTNLYIEGGEGGVNTYLTEKARHLAEREPDVEHAMIIPGARDRETRVHGSRVIAIKSPRYFRNPQHRIIFNRRAIRRWLRELDPDLVEVDCASKLGLIARGALGPGRSVVGFYHVHLPTFFARDAGNAFGSLAGRIAESLAWRMVRGWAKPCDRLVVTSGDIYERLITHGFTRLAHIPLGVNTALFRPAGGRAETGEPPVILHVGRLSREKHLHVLLDAFSRLRTRRKARLWIVGDGPLRDEISARAAELEDVTLHGLCHYGERLAEFYGQADVVAAPSPSETFGLTVLEALAAGVPVVAVRRGGPTHLVRPELGVLTEPDNPSDFARGLEAALDAPRDPAPRRSYVQAEYSWERTFERLVGLYRDLVAARELDRAPE